MSGRFEILIQAYLGEAEDTLHFLQEAHGRRNLLRAWKLNQIPQIGFVGECRYEMHGVGCLVRLPGGRSIDFDFADEALIGFDAWRLWKYACLDGEWPEYESLAIVEEELSLARAAGRIGQVAPPFPGCGNSGLYRPA